LDEYLDRQDNNLLKQNPYKKSRMSNKKSLKIPKV